MRKHKTKHVCPSCGEKLFDARICTKCKEIINLKYGESVVDGLIYKENSDGGMTLIYDYRYWLKLKGDKIIIPENVNGKPVTDISGKLFYKKIRLPNSVKRIHNWSIHCRDININQLKDLEYLGDGSFNEDQEQKELILPDSIKYIGRSLCCWNMELKTVQLPENAEYIGCYAFYNCNELKGIEIPPNVSFIGKFAFFNCASIESVNIPDKVEFLADGTFSCCSSLRKVTLGSGLKRIGRAFMLCDNLRKLTIPDSVEIIANGAFYGCNFLKIKYRGKIYTKENINEIYNDEPMPEYTSSIPAREFRKWKYAVPGKTSWFGKSIDNESIEKLTVYRKEDEIDLPRMFEDYYIPEELYNDEDVIISDTRCGKDDFAVWGEKPYGINEKWTGVKGRLKTALVSEQAKLLKKHFGIEVYFKYKRIGGNIGGFVLTRDERKIGIWNHSHIDKTLSNEYRYRYVKIENNVPEFIHKVNLMIKEYLTWCYRRRIDPFIYNIIPLRVDNGNGFDTVCHTDLGALVITERMKKERAERRVDFPFDYRHCVEKINHMNDRYLLNFINLTGDYMTWCFENRADPLRNRFFQNIKLDDENSELFNCLFKKTHRFSEYADKIRGAEFTKAAAGSGVDIVCSDSVRTNGRTLFERVSVICCNIGGIATAVIRLDSYGRLYPAIERFDANVDLSEIPPVSSFKNFCLLPADIISDVIKKCILAVDLKLPMYKVVIPVYRPNSKDPEKKWGMRRLFDIRIKEGKPDLTELNNYTLNIITE